MVKISLLLRNLQISQVSNSRILRIQNAKLSAFFFSFTRTRLFFYKSMHCLLNAIRSSFSVSEGSERKDSFVLLLPICSQEDSSKLFPETTFLFFFLLPLFLFLIFLIFTLQNKYAYPTYRIVNLILLIRVKSFLVTSLLHNNSNANCFCNNENPFFVYGCIICIF